MRWTIVTVLLLTFVEIKVITPVEATPFTVGLFRVCVKIHDFNQYQVGDEHEASGNGAGYQNSENLTDLTDPLVFPEDLVGFDLYSLEIQEVPLRVRRNIVNLVRKIEKPVNSQGPQYPDPVGERKSGVDRLEVTLFVEDKVGAAPGRVVVGIKYHLLPGAILLGLSSVGRRRSLVGVIFLLF